MFKKLAVLSISLFFITSVSAQNKLTPELLWKLGRVGKEAVSPDGNKVIYGVTYYDLKKNKGERNLYVVDSKSEKTTQLTTEIGSEHSALYSKDGKKIIFQKSGQLWEMKTDGSDKKQLTTIDGGASNYKISPNQKHILYTKEVKLLKTTKDLYPDLDKADVRIIDDLMYRHWDHETDEKFSHVFVANFNGSKIVGNEKDIMPDEKWDTPQQPFGGSEDVIWSPDSKDILYVSKKKYGKDYALSTNTDIYKYTLKSNSTENVTEGMMGYDTNPKFSNDGKKLAWLSMATAGYEADKNDIIIKDLKTGKIYNQTAKWDETVSEFTWGQKDKYIYFGAGIEATYQVMSLKLNSNLAKVNVEKQIKQITSGIHDIRGITATSKYIVASKKDMNHANEVYKFDIKNGKAQQLTHINDNVYAKLDLPKITKRWVKTTDNKKELVWVILPPNFDKTKKYPAIFYAQGGPQGAISQSYSFRWNFSLMASKGYVVIAPNRRGLPSFGVEWNKAISKDWGGQAMDDYLSAVDDVKKESWVDESKIGAVGASYGGYSVYMLAGIHKNRFATFISHCGLFDMKSWYLTTEEMFFANYDIGGEFWEGKNQKSYNEFNPINHIDKWNTPIMVIHGGKDYRVPLNQGMEAFQAAQLKNIPSKFLYFPNEGHWVLNPQNGIIWHTEYFKWLDKWLK
ncbi:MAG: S9 family peptidase [Ichthyobacteriaceae bacterium]|nr:S9 family peptidase [Ichthyobacteriaceae bacterium]